MSEMETRSDSTGEISKGPKYKNRLHEYAQSSGIALPLYQTFNEGSQHHPQFRSAVVFDGYRFMSSKTFLHIKESVQDAARVTLESLELKIKQEGCPFLYKDVTFSKSILNEFAAKIGVPLPTYEVIQTEGICPMFISTVKFHGESYRGARAKSKKEAEQIAARTTIEFLLGSSYGLVISQIIRVKRNFFAVMYESDNTMLPQNNCPGGVSKEMVPFNPNGSMPVTFDSQPSQYQGNIVGVNTSEPSSYPLVYQCFPQKRPLITTNLPAGKKRRNSKKKKAGKQLKKLCAVEEELVPIPAVSTPVT